MSLYGIVPILSMDIYDIYDIFINVYRLDYYYYGLIWSYLYLIIVKFLSFQTT